MVVADSPWPPTWGGAFRLIGLYDALAKHGRLTAFVLPIRRWADASLLPAGARLRPSYLPTRRLDRLLLRGRATLRREHPFTQTMVESGALSWLTGELQALRPDVVLLTFPFFGRFVESSQSNGWRTIVDLSDFRQAIARQQVRSARTIADRLRATSDLVALRHREEHAARNADEIWMASLRDVERLRAAGLPGTVRVVPNTIPMARYAVYRHIQPRGLLLGFLGSLDYDPNQRAVRRLASSILPRIQAAIPSARLRVIGRSPGPDIRKLLQSRSDIELYPDADDPLALLAETLPLVVPLDVGGGTRLKILEAAASGIPIVSSDLGVDGLDLRPGIDYLRAESDAQFADAVMALWHDPSLGSGLADSALDRVGERYDQAAADRAVAESFTDLGLVRP
jgi:glycosyltransferase involved in cell wall biosynthesis